MPEFARLLDGYERFREGRSASDEAFYARLDSDGQHPGLMVVSCSDSRVDPELIFDVEPGEVFVVRNVAALVPPYASNVLDGTAAAVEYAVGTLGVRQIVVLGHSRCGGCGAALHGGNTGRGSLARWIGLLGEERDRIEALNLPSAQAQKAMEEAAVRRSLANLRMHPSVANAEQRGALHLHGCHFLIRDGSLTVLDEALDAFAPARPLRGAP